MTKEDYFAQGLVKVKENDHLGAIELFTTVLNLDSQNADALSQRAVAYLNVEKYELSMKDMDLAVQLDPEYGYRYQCRAYLKTRIGKTESAIKDYEKAVELDPKDGIAYNNLALAQEQLGWAKQAKGNFNQSDKLMGIKTAQERAESRIENAKEIPTEKENKKESFPTELTEEQIPSKSEIAKSVFTKKSSFKEFIRFIGNGFKLKENDQN